MRHRQIDPALRPVPAEELLGDLRPVHQYRVDTLPEESFDGLTVRRHLISGMQRNGVDVVMSLRLFLRHPADSAVVFTLPGGGGRVDDNRMAWLARTLNANHAVVDWVGRGQSGSHTGLEGIPDPLFMQGDTFRDSFQFYNVSAMWAVLNWMFHAGYRPTDLVGGSWGGVYCFLMAAFDRRVERIFSSFGCGGFLFPGIEKRNYWDLAIEHIGATRFATWCGAFDPILRLDDIEAEVYFETATNDKFFSLDMAMETWRRVRRPIFLSLAPNQDHNMGAFGQQPYLLQRLSPHHPVFSRGRTIANTFVKPHVESGRVECRTQLSDDSSLRLAVSEQLPVAGNMSRDWRLIEGRREPHGEIFFDAGRRCPSATLLYFLTQEIGFPEGRFRATTPVGEAGPMEAGTHTDPETTCRLLDVRSDVLQTAPFGDKASPRATAQPDRWTLEFGESRASRATRYGIRSWEIPRDWSHLDVEIVGGVPGGRLRLVLSQAFHLRSERAWAQAFDDAEALCVGASGLYRFARDRFVPIGILDGRFDLNTRTDIPQVGAFDAVGLVDMSGGSSFTVGLVSIVVG